MNQWSERNPRRKKANQKGVCELGHKVHHTVKVKTKLGNLYVYDWNMYNHNEGRYCTGQDDVSRTIINNGSWADDESAVIRRILEGGDRKKVVLDFGSHIGWYSIMAAQMGYFVHAFEADRDNLRVMAMNAKIHGLENKIRFHKGWIDGSTEKQEFGAVELMKSDLEGNDRFAVRMVDKDFKAKNIEHLFIEISPVFNDTYPALVEQLEDWGYRGSYIDGQSFGGKFKRQFDLLFKPMGAK